MRRANPKHGEWWGSAYERETQASPNFDAIERMTEGPMPRDVLGDAVLEAMKEELRTAIKNSPWYAARYCA